MVTYDIFWNLGFNISIQPVLVLERFEDEIDEYYRNNNLVGDLSEPQSTDGGEEEPLREVFDWGYRHEKLDVKWLSHPVPGTANVQLAFLRVRLF